MEQESDKPAFKFLTFANTKEDAEKDRRLREAAAKIEQAVALQKSVKELIDYKEPEESEFDLANDTRPLYERLQEQRDKKKEAIEESEKLSNLVTKLDEDDVDYLNEVDRTKREEELRKRLEVQDLYEAKRRIDEQKRVEQEKKLKMDLIGSSLNRKESPLKSKLASMIKLRPKMKTTSKNEKTQQTTIVQTEDVHPLANKSIEVTSAAQSKNKTSNINEPKTDYKPAPDIISQKVDHIKTSNEDEKHNSQHAEPTNSCSCPKEVTICAGVLPSLPIVKRVHDSDDSDNSEDDLCEKLIPSGRFRHKKR